MGYVYKGTVHDAANPIPEIISTPGVFNAEKCGTTAGHKQHRTLGIPVCEPCREAMADYNREYRRRRQAGAAVRTGFNPDKCGTYAGYHRHLRSGVPACDACTVANSDYLHNFREARRAA